MFADGQRAECEIIKYFQETLVSLNSTKIIRITQKLPFLLKLDESKIVKQLIIDFLHDFKSQKFALNFHS